MNTSYGISTGEQDMLSEFEVNLVQAGAGKRFANYIIDTIVVFALTFLMLIIFYFIVGFPDAQGGESSVSSLVQTIIYSLIFAVIFGLIEGIFKGKTLGKLITGTRAVNMDGTNISFQTAFLRGLSRVAPFEPFSALGNPSYPWHDKWTRTYVVDEKESTLPKTN